MTASDQPAPKRRKKKNWRATLRAIHRDLGYTCLGLTVLYAISGFAVNHIEDWNPNYVFEQEKVALGPLDLEEVRAGKRLEDSSVRSILERLDLPPRWQNVAQRAPDQLHVKIAEPNIKLDLNLRTGDGTLERTTPIPVVRQSNILHLNQKKGLWTYVADAFAIALAFLAISGALILKGKQGVLQRGLWFTIAGFALPGGFLLYWEFFS